MPHPPSPAPLLAPGILVGDASPEMRDVLIRAVRQVMPHARLYEAKTGPEALAQIRTGQVNAVFIDATLPLLSGAEVMNEARREGYRPFLVLTSSIVMPNWGMLATELHAYEFLKKPFSGEDIESMLGNYQRMLSPSRILIADAGTQSRAVVKKVITASRFQMDIQETDNGGHAIKMARMQTFDAVLVDANLNGISGLETACQLQNMHPDLPVVSIMPSQDGGLGQSLKHLGLTHFLRKPFFTRDIDALMHQTHNLRRPYLMNAVMKAAATALAS